MTLNAKYGLLGDFGLRDAFQERIVPKSIEIDIEKLRMKFSARTVEVYVKSVFKVSIF